MAKENKMAIDPMVAAGTIINGVQLAKDLFTNKKKEAQRQDDRQVKQQGRINEVNAKTSKELADYEQMLKMKMWNDTNYGAQMKHAEMAGLSKAHVVGSGTAGTQGASVNGVSGGGAADAAATERAGNESRLMSAQLANIMANTEKTRAETSKISGVDTENAGEQGRATKFVNDMNELFKDKIGYAKSSSLDKEIISAEQANIEWEAFKTAIKGSVEDENNPLVKAKAAELGQKVAVLDNLIKDKTLKDDEHKMNKIKQEIEGFTADLTQLGINGTTTGIIMKILGTLGGIRVNTGKGVRETVTKHGNGKTTTQISRMRKEKK